MKYAFCNRNFLLPTAGIFGKLMGMKSKGMNPWKKISNKRRWKRVRPLFRQ